MVGLLWYKFKGYILGAGAIIASVLFAYLKGRKDGSDAAEAEARESLAEDVQSAKDIRDDVVSHSDAELDRRLSDWTREG